MCGIAGAFLNKDNGNFKFDPKVVLKKISHRGPDSSGHDFVSTQFGDLFFGHTRLSILDLSSSADQPMYSIDKSVLIVFNGEIYNYLELRYELQNVGYVFNTDSDTEVLIASYSHWGIDCVDKLIGMFSFVIYDKKEQKVILFRDAFGIKPMYYFLEDKQFGFSSELGPLKEIYRSKLDLNLQIVYDYLVHATYDHSYNTFYNNFKELRPGHILSINLVDLTYNIYKWWNPKITKPSSISYNDAVEIVREKFLANIKLHLRSDVPIGAALSGGIDSSAVVCGMRYIEPKMPLHTFSFIAEGKSYNENKWIDIVNEFVGAVPNKIIVQGGDIRNDIIDLIESQGQPFGSTSIYAEYRLYKAVNETNIRVVLNGQGADELLAGYDGYCGYKIASLIDQNNYFKIASFLKDWVNNGNRTYLQGIMEYGQLALPNYFYSNFRKLLGRNFEPNELNIKFLKDNSIIFEEHRDNQLIEFKARRVVERLLNSINGRGLPSLLRHGDRNSMRWSVEGRVPFLTVDFAEFLLQLPEDYLISQQGVTKRIFRDAMKDIVPDSILNRKDKIGFETPTEDWLIYFLQSELHKIKEYIENFEFINIDNYMLTLESYAKGKKPIDWRAWRMINLALWLKNQN
jgi:asparagine synthase (glutamine-hydrolysing)